MAQGGTATARKLRWLPNKMASISVHSAGIYNVKTKTIMACCTTNGCTQWKGSHLLVATKLNYEFIFPEHNELSVSSGGLQTDYNHLVLLCLFVWTINLNDTVLCCLCT